MSSLQQRRGRALKAVAASGAEGLLVTHGPDLRYLCGFTGSAGALVVQPGRSHFFTDGRYRDQAAAEVAGVSVHVEQRSAVASAMGWLGKEFDGVCAFDAEHTTVAALDGMRAALPARRRRSLTAVRGVVARLRERKDAEEVATLRRAAALGCRLFEGVLGELRPGVREAEIALAMEARARRGGAEAMSFETIVASGERSALPHGRASQARLPRRGFVTLDFGVVVDGYCSDMTRTVHMGRPSAEARSVYDSVLEAQLRAVEAVRSGVASGDVDEAARSALRQAGLEEWFTHSTGHGVGLEIHEGPRLAKGIAERLETGMVVTVEPGVYLPGRFGVRIEDMVLVGRGASEVLTPSTKALIEM